MKQFLIYTIAAACLIACKKEGAVQNLTKKDSTVAARHTQPEQTQLLETFPFPKDIEGCACYFAKNKADFLAEKYIYADDFKKTAFIKTGGEEIKLNLVSGNSPDDGDTLTKDVVNDHLHITITAKKIKDDEEVMLYEGTMTIETTEGQKITLPIYGECAC